MRYQVRNIIAICLGLTLPVAGCAYSATQGFKSGGENKAEYNNAVSSGVRQSRSQQPINSTGQKTDQISTVVDHLRSISASHLNQPLNDEIRSRIYTEVEQVREPADIVTLALICRSLESGDPDFAEAYWHCVAQLSEDTSDKAVDALNLLMQRSNVESGDKELFEEAIAHQLDKKRRENR